MNPKLARILIQKAMNVTVYIRVDQWPKPLPFSMVFESVEESLQVLSVPCGPHRETFQQIQEHPKAILKGIVSDHWFKHCMSDLTKHSSLQSVRKRQFHQIAIHCMFTRDLHH